MVDQVEIPPKLKMLLGHQQVNLKITSNLWPDGIGNRLSLKILGNMSLLRLESQ